MKNHGNPSGAPIGPKHNWAEWRARQDKAIQNPARNTAAIKLNAGVWLPISTAPKDGTLMLLIVSNPVEDLNCHPLEDDTLSRTVGFNNFDHDGDDVWHMAGWSWDQDTITAGHGKPKKWMPFPKMPGSAP